ncbi:hypothetical protein [Rickettsia gravesii]|uniref:hypothetical protein n=1 Tax=Rickettsia gravesii TaxID=354585 RepID=UPI00037E79B4|nr:hypothetical protein [Rickettsia gravesii]
MAHKDLSHLTEEQIKDLIKRYYNYEKIANLLEEFNVNVSPNSLVSLFLLVTHHKLFCKYCRDTNLVIKLKSRNYYSYVYGETSLALLGSICNHNNNSSCSCDNCKKAIKQQKQTEEEAKRRILIDTFLYKNIKAPPIEELTLKDALYLLSVVEHSASEDLEFVKPYLKGYSVPSLAPDEDLNDHIVGHLGRRGFVLINPLTSSLDAFKFNQEKALTEYYPNKVLWDLLPNMDIEEKKEYLNSVRNINIVKGEWSSSWKKEVSDIWNQIAKYECIENFKYL